MDDKNTNVTKSHKVLLANRKSGAFSGVVDVLSFDVAEILLETELGMLLIKGHDLHVNRLTLEKGEIDIEGRIYFRKAVQMMAVSAAISEQAASLGVSILIGGALFLLYDIFRIFRRVVPHGNFWIGVEDFFYWLCCTAVVFVMLYRENDGMVRGFSIGGIMIGMLLYYFLLSRFVIRINVMVFGTVFGLLGKIFGTILLPFRKHGKKIIHFLRKRLKKVCRAVKIGLCKL